MDTRPNIEIVSRLSVIHNQEIMDTDRTSKTPTPQASSEHQFSTIFPHHLKEWKKSCVDEKLTTLDNKRSPREI